MFKKKYRRKLNRKFKRKYKGKIRGRGFGDGFKLLYSLRNQWPNSMQWGDKILKNFKRNIKILKCGYCQKTACQSWHQKFLVSCKYYWEAFCKACHNFDIAKETILEKADPIGKDYIENFE